GHVVGIVSGRRLDDLTARVGVPGVWYVGVHGFFIRAPQRTRMNFLTRVDRHRIARATAQLTHSLRGISGVVVEPKSAAIAVHYRRAGPVGSAAAKQAVLAVANCDPNLRILPGDKVWEILPRKPINKSEAVRFILRREQPHVARGRRLA